MPLGPPALRWRCDPEQFDFETTAQLPDFTEIVGQQRALEAVQFGVTIRREGFNLFVLGPPGVGKRTVVEQCLRAKAAAEPAPSDWCYVNRFDDIRRPRAIRFAAGRGEQFRKDVKRLVEELENAIPAALETDEQKSRIQDAVRAEGEQQNKAFQSLASKALQEQVQLIRTPGGFALGPLRNGEVLSSDEFHKLPDDERARIEQTVASLQKELESVIEQIPRWNQETKDKIRNLNREAVRLAIGHLMSRVKERCTDLPQARDYLESVERDILERIDEFQPPEDAQVTIVDRSREQPSFADYEINLLVDNGHLAGAPIIYEDHPSYHNLIGRVEHESHMGALTTDFTLIKAGALHRSNGGYLILDALRLLQQPFAWEGLKRALYARSIKIESLGEMLSLISTVTLEPEPIPLDTKVVLLGDRLLYYLLHEGDHDFAELFKVAADFDDDLDRSPETCRLYARFLATLARREQLRPLNRDAIATVIEHAVREANDQDKLSIHMRAMADVLREADHWAGSEAVSVIDSRHIERAVNQQRVRADRVRQRIQEEIRQGTILIDTDGSRVGQVNGLSVVELGNTRFGQPTRITATARLGRGDVVDIEREVELGGAIHSKGVLILSSFLAARFAREQPLSLAASLVFEQSYAMVEGDSASVAELVALLSAIAELPIRQDLAVTGSVNQLGHVQPVGGVNEKIEGFFDVCCARGLTNGQGVLIPATNARHLMLRREIVEAVAAGRFRVYAIQTVDQAAALLTGLPAGELDALTGKYPDDSVNGRVAARLAELTKLRLLFAAEPGARAHGPVVDAQDH